MSTKRRIERSKLATFGGLPIAALIGIFAPTVAAVTPSAPPKVIPFVTNPSTFKPSVTLPATDNTIDLPIPLTKLKKRISESRKNDFVEPVEVTVPTKYSDRKIFCEALAKPHNAAKVMSFFEKRMSQIPREGRGGPNVPINLDGAILDSVQTQRLGHQGLRLHHQVTVGNNASAKVVPRNTIREFRHQLAPFIAKDEREVLAAKLKNGVPISVDTELLPSFAQQMVGKYLIYRGPNCFHAALAFHGPELTDSPLLNVRRETGYHPAMVNYDELWRVLQSQFYEVDTARFPLKYGDLLIFFDYEDGKEIDFRWIRHAAVYLFNNFTFSKGSKSPNTPYTVKTLTDEWNTWQQYSKKLGVKVFRRASRNAIKYPPEVLTNWIY